MATASGFLGLMEIVDHGQLSDVCGKESAEQQRDEFFNRLASWLRPGDQLRILAKNRFLVVLNNIGGRAELELATAKLARLFAPSHPLPDKFYIHAGFAVLDTHSGNSQASLQQAHTALCQAKKANELYKVFNANHHNPLQREHELVKSLQTATESGELQFYYQPKFCAGCRYLVGAEALIRWHTRDHRVIMPDDFITVAERHSVIRPITWWGLKAAIARLTRWPQRIGIAVNVAPTLLMDDEILAIIADALDMHHVRPSRLTVEITENIMTTNQQAVLEQLARLRKLGVKVSIDDFGAGYSSLAYFRNLPADELKIDKSFVTHMLTSPKDFAIVKAVIELAHKFSIKVVAEGVEDHAIARRLTELGCDHLQGFAFDRPLPLEAFERRYFQTTE